jgi:hypothetical protein
MDQNPRQGHVPYLDNRGLRLDESLTWIEATPDRPCPRCGATAGCAVSDDRRFVWCRLVVSAHPLDGAGWLHAAPSVAVEPG